MTKYEETLDQVDKLSLQGKYDIAQTLIDLDYPQLFNPEEWFNLTQLVATNKAKRGDK